MALMQNPAISKHTATRLTDQNYREHQCFAGRPAFDQISIGVAGQSAKRPDTTPGEAQEGRQGNQMCYCSQAGDRKIGDPRANNSPGSEIRSTWQPLRAPLRLTV